MASFDKRCRLTKRHEYILRAPAHFSEISKAIDAAEHDRDHYITHNGGSPSDVWVTSDDENVIIYWEHTSTNTSS